MRALAKRILVIVTVGLVAAGCGGTADTSEATVPAQPVVTSTTIAPTTTASRPTTTKATSTTEFGSFLQGELVGTSYSIDSVTSEFGKIQVETHMFFAESICIDLEAGRSESDLRRVRAEEEKLDDPVLDRDIPVYVDAIFEAAKIYVCP